MYSINRLFFFSLGSVCFLLVPIFWLSLLFDFGALENFVVKLSTAEFVGYPIPELLGSPKEETVVDQVLRIKIFLTVLVVTYSLLFIGLSFLEGGGRRIRFCARGIAIPLFLLTLVFWIKFITDDHIISKIEKSELFEYTIVCLAVSVLLFVYSFHSRKKVKRSRLPNFDETGEAKFSVPRKSTSSSEPHSAESSSSEEGNLTATATAEESSDELPPPADPGVSTPGDMGVESEPVGELPPPLPEEEAVDPVGELPPPLPEEEAVDPVGELPPPLPEEEAVEPVGELPPPLPEEEAVEPVGELPPPLPEEEAVEPVGELPPPLPEEEPTGKKSILPPPSSSPPPASSGQSIAESYQFPSEKEDPPNHQSGDSSLEADDKKIEELKPPPF